MNGMEEKPRSRMTPQKVRALWRKAILETLLLIRMERENKSLQGEGRIVPSLVLWWAEGLTQEYKW